MKNLKIYATLLVLAVAFSLNSCSSDNKNKKDLNSKLNDKQTIISLAHEARDKIKVFEDKIEALSKAVNENNYLKTNAKIQNLKKKIDPIKKICIENINKIAEKRTIIYTTKKSDPAKYYDIESLKVKGAHWNGSYITILQEVSFTKKDSAKTEEIYNGKTNRYIENLRELRFQFKYKDNNSQANKHTILIFNKQDPTSFAISFENFEREIDYVDFYSSSAKKEVIK